jgi:hypothetical protein
MARRRYSQIEKKSFSFSQPENDDDRKVRLYLYSLLFKGVTVRSSTSIWHTVNDVAGPLQLPTLSASSSDATNNLAGLHSLPCREARRTITPQKCRHSSEGSKPVSSGTCPPVSDPSCSPQTSRRDTASIRRLGALRVRRSSPTMPLFRS